MSIAKHVIGIVALAATFAVSPSTYATSSPTNFNVSMHFVSSLDQNDVDGIEESDYLAFAPDQAFHSSTSSQPKPEPRAASMSPVSVNGAIDGSFFMKPEVEYVAKIVLLAIIAFMAMKTFRKFQTNRLDEEGDLHSESN